MYKAVVSDLDGTLLNEEHKVSSFTKETIELLLKKGIKINLWGEKYGNIWRLFKIWSNWGRRG